MSVGCTSLLLIWSLIWSRVRSRPGAVGEPQRAIPPAGEDPARQVHVALPAPGDDERVERQHVPGAVRTRGGPGGASGGEQGPPPDGVRRARELAAGVAPGAPGALDQARRVAVEGRRVLREQAGGAGQGRGEPGPEGVLEDP